MSRSVIGGLILVLLLLTGTSGADNPVPLAPEDAKLARSRLSTGQTYLGLSRLEDAKTNCDAALKADPANEAA